MENVLKARITADISDFKAKMGQAELATEGFEKTIEGTQTAVSDLDKVLAVLIKEVASLSGENAKSKVSIQALTDSLEKERKTIMGLSAELEKLKNAPTSQPKALGILQQLNQRARELKQSIAEGTNLLSIARLNKELEATESKIKRIEALGRTASNSAQGVQKLTQSAGSANAVFQEFNRTLQDAPFGIIGVGNNLQQLASSFGTLRSQTGSTSQALKLSLGSLVGGINPAILAFTALTTGLTLYSQGAFDGIFATKSFQDQLDKFRESLSETDSARLESLKNTDEEIIKLNSLRAIIEDETVSRDKRLLAVQQLKKEFPAISKNLTDEAFLAGQVAGAYEEVTKQLIARAEVESTVKRIVDLNDQERLILEQNKGNLEEINAVRARIAEFQDKANKAEQDFLNAKDASEKDLALRRQLTAENQIRFLRGENEAVDALLKIEEDRTNLKQVANNALKESLTDTQKLSVATESENKVLESQVNTLGIISGLRTEIKNLEEQKDLAKSQEEINILTGKINLLKEELALINAIANRANTPIDRGIDTSGLPSRDGNIGVKTPTLPGVFTGKTGTVGETEDAAEVLKRNLDEIDSKAKQVQESFSVLGSVISTVFKDNPALGQFVSSLAKFAGEIISRNFAIAKSNAIAGASTAGVAAGPAAPFVTPGLIAAAIAVVATAFSGIFKGSGGGSSGGSSQTFTNVPGREFGGSVIAGKPYIVGEKRPELFVPSTNGIIVPRIDNIGASSASGSAAMGGKLTVEVIGMIENDSIRLANKRGMQKVSRT